MAAPAALPCVTAEDGEEPEDFDAEEREAEHLPGTWQTRRQYRAGH